MPLVASEPKQVTCWSCCGTGLIDDGEDRYGETIWDDCPRCKGTGLIDPPPPYVHPPPKRRSIKR
jgi:DnaJ-class molecular chaperone